MIRTEFCALLLCVSTAGVFCLPEVIKIAGLFSHGEDILESAFMYTVDMVNTDSNILPKSKLSLQVEHLKRDKSLDTYSKVCRLLEGGVVAVFGPRLAGEDSLVASTCGALHVPHLQTAWHHDLDVKPFSLGLSPDPTVLGDAFRDFIVRMDWLFFVYIYEGHEALVRLQELERHPDIMERKLLVFDIQADYDDDPDDNGPGRRKREDITNDKDVWDLIKETRHRNFIIDVEQDHIEDVLRKAKNAGLMTELHSFLVTSLDFHAVDTKELSKEHASIYSFRLVNLSNDDLALFSRRLAKFHPDRPRKSEEKETQVALIHDAINVLAKALHNMSVSGVDFQPNPVECDNATFLEDGQQLFDAIRETVYDGFTGTIQFDEDGMREVDALTLWRLDEGHSTQVASWTPDKGLDFLDDPDDDDGIVGDEDDIDRRVLENRTLIITTILSPPFVMLKDEAQAIGGNERFEGFCVELLEKLSKKLHFHYQIKLVDDGQYGTEIEPGMWTGLVGEIVEGRADMAVAPLTMTSSRLSVVQYTVPFMKIGIGVMYNREDETVVHTFFSPFTAAVWVYVVISILVATVLVCLIGRVTPFQWDFVSDTRMDSDFTVGNTFWFLFSALMFQRMSLTPRSPSTVVAFVAWWLFCIVIIVAYATVLGGLIIRYKDSPTLDEVWDLLDQSQIKYGTLRSGSTQSFFQGATFPRYMELWQGMQSQGNSAFVDNYAEGIDRVIRGGYALFMESPVLKYIEARYCEVEQVGDIIGSSGYAIALPHGASYNDEISASITELKMDGTLQLMEQYWWESHNVANCPPEEHIYRPTPFTVRFGRLNLVFIFLLLGLIITMVITLVNFARKHSKKTVSAGTSESRAAIWNTLLEELRAAVTCQKAGKQGTGTAEDGEVQQPATSPA